MGQDNVTDQQRAQLRRAAQARMDYLQALVIEMDRVDPELAPGAAIDLLRQGATAIRQLAGMEQ